MLNIKCMMLNVNSQLSTLNSQLFTQLLFVGQVVIAPLLDDDTVVQQHQARLSSHHCFQHPFLSQMITIFSSCVVTPVLLVAWSCRGREAVEADVVILCVVIHLVHLVHTSLVCISQVGDDEQEGISVCQ